MSMKFWYIVAAGLETRVAELERELANTAPYYMDALDRESKLTEENYSLKEKLKETFENARHCMKKKEELERENQRLREAVQKYLDCIPRILEDEMDRIISIEAIDAVGQALEIEK